MYKMGFLKLGLVNPLVKAGSVSENTKEVIKLLKECKNASVILLPKLPLTSNCCNDLFLFDYLYEEELVSIKEIRDLNLDSLVILSAYIKYNSSLCDVFVALLRGKIIGIIPSGVDKKYFKNSYFDEITYINFLGEEVPFGKMLLSSSDDKVKIAVSDFSKIDDSLLKSANLVLVPSFFDFYAKREEDIKTVLKGQAIFNNQAVVILSSLSTETSSAVLPLNFKLAYSSDEALLEEVNLTQDESISYIDVDLERINYQRRKESYTLPEVNEVEFDLEEGDDYEFTKPISKYPFLNLQRKDYEQIIKAQAMSLLKRLNYIGIDKVVIGVSGGLDSTLALLCAAYAFDLAKISRKNILAYTLPCTHTSSNTKSNAWKLMEGLGVGAKEINITEDVEREMKTISHTKQDVTYENIQARFRTYTLMNIANKEGAIVVGTSDMSEVALGWSTFNGDQMAMYGVNAGVPKTLIRELVRFYKEIYPEVEDALDSIIDTPISPELSQNQKTEDIIGKYEINDFLLYNILNNGYTYNKLAFIVTKAFGISLEDANSYIANFNKRFYHQQYKRLTMPEGIRLLKVNLSPRGGLDLAGDIYEKKVL